MQDDCKIHSEIGWLEERLSNIRDAIPDFEAAKIKEFRGYLTEVDPHLSQHLRRESTHWKSLLSEHANLPDRPYKIIKYRPSEITRFLLLPFVRFFNRHQGPMYLKLSSKTFLPKRNQMMDRAARSLLMDARNDLGRVPTLTQFSRRVDPHLPDNITSSILDEPTSLISLGNILMANYDKATLYDAASKWCNSQKRIVGRLRVGCKEYLERNDVRMYYMDIDILRHICGSILQRIWTPKNNIERAALPTAEWYPLGGNVLTDRVNIDYKFYHKREQSKILKGDISSFTANCVSPLAMVLSILLTIQRSDRRHLDEDFVVIIMGQPLVVNLTCLLKIYLYKVAFPIALRETTPYMVFGGCLGVSWNMQLTVSYFTLFMKIYKWTSLNHYINGIIAGDDFLFSIVTGTHQADKRVTHLINSLVTYLGKLKSPRIIPVDGEIVEESVGLFCKKRTIITVTATDLLSYVRVRTKGGLPLLFRPMYALSKDPKVSETYGFSYNQIMRSIINECRLSNIRSEPILIIFDNLFRRRFGPPPSILIKSGPTFPLREISALIPIMGREDTFQTQWVASKLEKGSPLFYLNDSQSSLLFTTDEERRDYYVSIGVVRVTGHTVRKDNGTLRPIRVYVGKYEKRLSLRSFETWDIGDMTPELMEFANSLWCLYNSIFATHHELLS